MSARTAVIPLSLDDRQAWLTAARTPGTYMFDGEGPGSNARVVADNLLKAVRRSAEAHGCRIVHVVRGGTTYWFDVVPV